MNEIKYDEFVSVIADSLKQSIKLSPIVLSLKSSADADIKKFYELCRTQMKKRMAQNAGCMDKWNEQRLDRHKIAAAVCWAVVRCQPILIKKTGACADDRIANEMVAFSAPLKILLSFAADDATTAGKPTLASYFSNGPSLPSTTDKISFSTHVARCLFWRNHMNSDAEASIDKWLDPFQLAIMYYMIEVFTSLEGQRWATEP